MALGTGTSIEGAVKPSSIAVDGYEPSVFAHRYVEIETNQQGRWEYDGNNNIVYAGYAPKGLAESSNGWLLHYFVYTGSNITSRQIAYDAWSNRATASYS